jgi:Putative phage serine protease XkdF
MPRTGGLPRSKLPRGRSAARRSNLTGTAHTIEKAEVPPKYEAVKATWEKVYNMALRRFANDEAKAKKAANQAAEKALQKKGGASSDSPPDSGEKETKKEIELRVEKMEQNPSDPNYFFGWGYICEKGGARITDVSGQRIDIYELEKSFYPMMLNYRSGRELHKEKPDPATVVEGIVFTPEKYEAMGFEKNAEGHYPGPLGAWLGFYVHDQEVKKKILDGTYKMLSIGGWSQQKIVEDSEGSLEKGARGSISLRTEGETPEEVLQRLRQVLSQANSLEDLPEGIRGWLELHADDSGGDNPLYKHATHNQETHGNRGRSSGGSGLGGLDPTKVAEGLAIKAQGRAKEARTGAERAASKGNPAETRRWANEARKEAGRSRAEASKAGTDRARKAADDAELAAEEAEAQIPVARTRSAGGAHGPGGGSGQDLQKAADGFIQFELAEAFSTPGTANVSVKDRAKLKGLLAHYGGKAKPFTACKADQIKHGLSEDHANRRCAVLKDLIRGTTRWRSTGKAEGDPDSAEVFEFDVDPGWVDEFFSELSEIRGDPGGGE